MQGLGALLRKSGKGATFGSFELITVSQPWRLFTENPTFQDGIIAEAGLLASQSFGGEKTSDSIRQHLLDVDVVTVLLSGDEVIGFCSARFDHEYFTTFIEGVVVKRGLSGSGAGRNLLQKTVDAVTLPQIGLTTQNPIVYCMLASMSEYVYPSPDSRRVVKSRHEVGKHLMQYRAGSFDHETFVSKELYDSCLYPTIPECKVSVVNDWFQKSLQMIDRKSRDGFLLIGEKKR